MNHRSHTQFVWVGPAALVVIAVTISIACGDVGDAPRARTGDAIAVTESRGTVLPVDTARSTVNWRAAKVTRSHDGGFRSIDGSVSILDNQIISAHLVIDTRSIWSDTERLTNHLKSEDFFEVESYPEAVFEAHKFEAVDSVGATHLVSGNLTMHGHTNGVVVPAKVTVEEGSVRVQADFIIDRTQWGINYKGRADDLVSDDVRLMLDIVAVEDQSLASE